MPMLLEKELALYGAKVEADEFNEIIQELHCNMHPSWNTEQLLYNPIYGVRFCEAARSRCGKDLPDEMILRRLQNCRKNTNIRKPRSSRKG